MKKIYTNSILAVTFLVLLLGACKKADVVNVTDTTDYKTQTDDQLLISAEIDAVTIDANTAVEATDYFFARNTNSNNLCDGKTTVDSSGAFKVITIDYDGINCAGKTKRKGQVIVSMQKNKKWSNAGAVLNISYRDLVITRIGDNKTIILNGNLDLTNESGGRLSDIMLKNLVHSIHSSSMKITFEDGTTRTWQLAVKRTFSFDNGLVISSTGDHANGAQKGISAWGTTRAGKHFVTMIAEPMIIRQDCYFRLVSAKLVQEQGDTLTITFGLNEQGEKVACPAGSFYLQVNVGTGSSAKSFLLPY
jgi:hypothetical protein